MVDYRAMQLNMGVGANSGALATMPTPTPAETSARLMQEATQRSMVSTSIIQQSGGVVPPAVSAFSQQFQQQFQAAKSYQSYDPLVANQMSGGAANGYLPSPLLMTPASTGVFRPPAPNAYQSIPPIQMPVNAWSPFTPQIPAPMFQGNYSQALQMQDYSAARNFSYASQIPRGVGMGLGLGAGAAAGAAAGSMFGMPGRVVGALGGAAIAGMSGFASGMGDIFNLPMQPAIQRREMGAAIQNMSQSWVVSGPQLHGVGKGLSRDAAISMAGEVQGLAGDMFNRRDLMGIMRKGGQAGLFDDAQTVPAIKQRLKETADTIKQFMSITNDPDVNNIIREMGKLRQFGLNQQDMLVAAQGMKTFSRAAGMSLQGLQEVGGLPGAMIFQRSGLTAGQGFQYGNFAAASAKQLMASGGISERQLALFGGVQGMAQRDTQAQAALSSMPLFAASNMQYGPQGWGVNGGNVGQVSRGAFGMVQNASQAMNQAVARGGIGALAMMPLQMREMADKAASMMTPQEQMAQRFQLAQQTGEKLGMSGESAMAAGSRLLYGNEVAEQMMVQARSPEFWRNQREIGNRRRREVYASQRQKDLDAESMLPEGLRQIGRGLNLDLVDDQVAKTTSRAWGSTKDAFRSIGNVISAPFSAVGDYVEDEGLSDQGIRRRRRGSAVGSIVSGMRESDKYSTSLGGDEFSQLIREKDVAKYRGGARDYNSKALAIGLNARNNGEASGYATAADWAVTPLEKVLQFGSLKTGLVMAGAEGITGLDLSDTVADVVRHGAVSLATAGLTEEGKYDVAEAGSRIAREQLKTVREARKKDKKVLQGVYGNLGKGDTGAGSINVQEMGGYLERIFLGKSTSGSTGIQLSDDDYIKAMIPVLKSQEGLDETQARRRAQELLATPGVKSTILGSAMENTSPENRILFRRELEEETSGGLNDGIGLNKLKDDEVNLEKKLGIYDDSVNWGIDWLKDKTTPESVKNLKKVAGKVGGQRLAALGAYAALGKDADYSKKREIQKKHGLSVEGLQEIQDLYSGLDNSTQERLAKIVRTGGKDVLANLEAFGDTERQIGTQETFKSEGFKKLIGQYSSGASEYLDSAEGITSEGLSQQFSDEDLARMSKGDARSQGLAKLVRASRGTGKDADRARMRLQNLARDESGIDAAGNEDVAAGTVGGKEAESLDKAESAMAAMEDVARAFKPAVKEFTEGARMLREAMESDIIAKRE